MNKPVSPEVLIDALVADPSLLLQNIDLVGGGSMFVRITEEIYKASMFLDNRLQVKNPQTHITNLWPLAELVGKRIPEQAPLNFVFHVGHCGSTMMSRMLEDLGGVLALREPLPLRWLAGAARELNTPLAQLDEDRYLQLQTLLLRLYARTYRNSDTALIKATSDCSFIADRLLATHPSNKAVLLYVSLDTFLTGMLRSDLRRQETLQFSQSRLHDLHSVIGAEHIRLFELDVAQKTAVSWLANVALLHKLTEQKSAEQCLFMNFETFLSEPVPFFKKMTEFLQMDVGDKQIEQVVFGPIIQAYSKDPNFPYNPAARAAELNEARQKYGEEIKAAYDWANQICERFPALHNLKQFFN